MKCCWLLTDCCTISLSWSSGRPLFFQPLAAQTVVAGGMQKNVLDIYIYIYMYMCVCVLCVTFRLGSRNDATMAGVTSLLGRTAG
ncbi:hypothetical protein SODALDRAFT_24294 [Sodiomyces alkalinus F11]|uniref:Uncharacterized protein n=1 Tax=Sodiomyces alkalinus (strain CBS 110278 / VKM F-3762 / F11) TaxID=1314773 RepID=A0A3N2Q815_SODAK|nr:hypothetical protein SODALDRAFT_24294 [Sodiomyces alkalinus F11]ROT42808.1 hypothetical protein SODALDRAFT_24294 [Sodiomyces alkalinus F11]